MYQARRHGGNGYCPTQRALSDLKDRNFFNEKNEKFKKAKSLRPLTIFRPLRSPSPALYVVQSHSVRAVPVFDGPVKKRGQGFKPSAQSPVSFSGGVRTQIHANGRWPNGQRKQKRGFQCAAQRKLPI